MIFLGGDRDDNDGDDNGLINCDEPLMMMNDQR